MASLGIDRRTGARLTGWAHVRQSLRDIVLTSTEARVMRRGYGSEAPRLVDAPANSETLLTLYASVAEAVERFEPRFRLRQVTLVEATAGGRAELALFGVYYPRGHFGDRSEGVERDARLTL